MRAFMSNSDARAKAVVASLDFSPSGDLAGYDAEREARAILAETERSVWGEAKTLTFLGAFHEERWPEHPCIDCAAGHALAESLAAFLEQEL